MNILLNCPRWNECFYYPVVQDLQDISFVTTNNNHTSSKLDKEVVWLLWKTIEENIFNSYIKSWIVKSPEKEIKSFYIKTYTLQ